MAELTKGQARKKEAMLKSVNGDEKAANAMFEIWMAANAKPAVVEDKVATAIESTMATAFPDGLKLGNKGYSLKRAKGKGASGYTATKIV